MANVRLVTPNAADDASITVSPAAVSTLPVTNLQDSTRSKVWRSTSLAQQTINGDFAAITAASAIGLFHHNLSATATIRCLLYSGAGQTGSTLYDSTATAVGTASAGRHSMFWPGSSGAGSSSFRILVRDDLSSPSDNEDGYIEASRLVIGDYFEPGVNMSKGMQLSWQESTRQYRTDGGTLRSDNFDPYRRWSFRLALLTEAEREELLEIIRVIGMRQDFVISGYPTTGGATERDFSGLVKITQMPPFIYSPADYALAKFEADLVMEES